MGLKSIQEWGRELIVPSERFVNVRNEEEAEEEARRRGSRFWKIRVCTSRKGKGI
ncbi:hypothetical protein Bca4012_052374 [Brassica carinata]